MTNDFGQTNPDHQPGEERKPDPSFQKELMEKLNAMRRRTKIVRRLVSVFIGIMLVTALLTTWTAAVLPVEFGVSATTLGGRTLFVRNFENAMTNSQTAQVGELLDGAITWQPEVNGTINGIEQSEKLGPVVFFDERAVLLDNQLQPLAIEQGGKSWHQSPLLGSPVIGCAGIDRVYWLSAGKESIWLSAPDDQGREVTTKLSLKDITQPILSIGCFTLGMSLHVIVWTTYGDGKSAPKMPNGQVWCLSFVPTLEQAEDESWAWTMADYKVSAIASQAAFSLPIALDGRFGVLWRSAEDSKSYVRFGAFDQWSEPRELPAELDAVLPRPSANAITTILAGQLRPSIPLITGTADQLQLFQRAQEGGDLTLLTFAIEEDASLGPAKVVGNVKAGLRTEYLPESLVLGLMLVSFLGVLSCTMWLGVQRRPTFEMEIRALALEKVGRDTSKLEAGVGLPIDLLIPWANALRRALAFAIDVVALFPLLLLLAQLANFDENLALDIFSQGTAPVHGLTERASFLMLIAAYGFVCEYYFGRTLGKAVMRIQVVTAKGQRAGALQIWLRNLLRVVEFLVPMGLLFTFLAMSMTRKHQRIGDLIARTGVRVMPPPSDPSAGEPSHNEE